MAMGLASLGRGKIGRTLYFSALHTLGAALGGAIVGGLLGWLGSLLSLSLWRPEIIAVTAVLALWQHLSRRPATLGLQRQVPRIWAQTMVPEACYFLWGVLLGSGIATLIPYSAFLVILATQLTSGVFLGCLSGALFGATREIVALLPLLGMQKKWSAEKLPLLLPALRTKVRQFNLLWLLAGGLVLVVMSLR